MLANVRLITDKDAHTSRLYLNGEDISDNVRNVHVNVGIAPCIPEVTVKLLTTPFEYNGEADVKYDFMPHSKREALTLIKQEIVWKTDFYSELVDNVVASLNTESCVTQSDIDDGMLDSPDLVQKAVRNMAIDIVNGILKMEVPS